MGAGGSVAAADAAVIYRDASSDLAAPAFCAPAKSAAMASGGGATPVHVIIDGMNVALANVPSYETDGAARRAAGLRGLSLAIDFFTAAGIAFKVFAPRGWVDDHPELEGLRRASVLFATPGGRDDAFMLAHADNHGSFIVSNDRFLDHVADRGYDKRWLDFHRVPFMFDPSFAPDPDALERMRAVHAGAAPPYAAPKRARDPDAAAAAAARAGAAAPPSAVVVVRGPPPRQQRAQHQQRAQPRPLQSRTAQALALFADRDGALLDRVALAAAAPGDAAVESVLVPRAAVGRIIGSRGANIQEIERNSGARVDVLRDDDANADIAEVRVTHEDAACRAQAVEAITDIVSRGKYAPPRSRVKPRADSDDAAMDTS